MPVSARADPVILLGMPLKTVRRLGAKRPARSPPDFAGRTQGSSIQPSTPQIKRAARGGSLCWWRRGGSNSRPSHCERDALPAELRPHLLDSSAKMSAGQCGHKPRAHPASQSRRAAQAMACHEASGARRLAWSPKPHLDGFGLIAGRQVDL